MITEEKSQDLPYAIWRMRETGGLIQSESKGLITRGANGVSSNSKVRDFGCRWHNPWSESEGQRTRNASVPGQKMAVSDQAENTFTFPLPCSSMRGLRELHDACPHWWKQSSLLSLLIKVLISSRNTLRDTSRINDLTAIWASSSPVKLTGKINHQVPKGTHWVWTETWLKTMF